MPIPKIAILVVNIFSLVSLLGLTMMLFIARKHIKTGISLAVIIILTTFPIYLYNICFIKGWFNVALVIAPFAYSSGTAFFPALWLFVHRYFNIGGKFSRIRLIHFIPTTVCLVVYSVYIILLSFPDRMNFILLKNTYMSNWIEALNITVIAIQAITYTAIIFIYMGQVKKFIGKTLTESQWRECLWISKTIYLLIIAFTVLLVGHHFWETIKTWLLNIMDVLIMFYFTYHVMNPSGREWDSKEEPMSGIQFDTQIEQGPTPAHKESEEYARIITEYLKTSKIYLKPTLTIDDVANITGISNNNIAHALKAIYQCSFFDFINSLRIERAIQVLNSDVANEQNMATITYQSGFSSKQAFYAAFKKNIGKTPDQFMEEIGRMAL